MEDSCIVQLYLDRDEAAISATSEKYGARLRRIAQGIVDDFTAAEACENDTYLEAWNLIPPNEPRTYLFAFLGRITRHLAIDECRRSGAQKRHARVLALSREMEECIPSRLRAEDAAEVSALAESLNGFLASCSREQRDVFVRRYWFFDSVPDIAKRYGYSASKVKTMLHRMRRDLAARLEKEGYTI